MHLTKIPKLMSLYEAMLFEISMDTVEKKYVSDTGEEDGKVSKKVFQDIKKSSNNVPTYAQWLVRQVIWGNIKEEDIYKYEAYFDVFKRRGREFPSKNIFDYGYNKNTPAEAQKEIQNFIKTAADLLSQEDSDISSKKGVTKSDKYAEFKLGEVDGYEVYEIPEGRKDLYGMSCELGSGTEWCTATGNTRQYFEEYIDEGSLYIFVKGDEKYQLHYESDSFMDKYDNPV